MGNFYDQWLNYWDDEQEERAKARKVIHEEELEWVRTRQDWKAALVCGRENGFITAGVVMVGVIPPGWNTGKHAHGEESIYIMEGEGFSVVDGKRYDWDAGSCLFMPYGSEHKHFNAGKKEARYCSSMGLALQRFASLAKVIQLEDACETPMGALEGIEMAASDIHPEYGRIVLKSKDAPVVGQKDQKKASAKLTDEFHLTMAKEMRDPNSKGNHGRSIHLMIDPKNNFQAREVKMTHVMCDLPGQNSEKHGHMEAIIYILQGEGHSIVDGEKIAWKKGSLVHVQGPQTVHQHFNTGKGESQFLRIDYGFRASYFQPIAKRMFPYTFYEFSSY